MLIGHACISTPEQNLRGQRLSLPKAGYGKIFTDVPSGSKAEDPGPRAALSILRKCGTPVVCRLDRLRHSPVHLIQTVKTFNERAVGFKSLQENIDTLASGDQLVFHIFGVLLECERELGKDESGAGIPPARDRLGGRPPSLNSRQVNSLKPHYQYIDILESS